jgi:hypothetical protein
MLAQESCIGRLGEQHRYRPASRAFASGRDAKRAAATAHAASQEQQPKATMTQADLAQQTVDNKWLQERKKSNKGYDEEN